MSTEPTVLLTGGRAPVALHLARLFKGAGFRVLSAESMKCSLLSFSNAVDRCFSLPGPVAEVFATRLTEALPLRAARVLAAEADHVPPLIGNGRVRFEIEWCVAACVVAVGVECRTVIVVGGNVLADHECLG